MQPFLQRSRWTTSQFGTFFAGYRLRWLGLENTHILALSEIPVYADHKDPFDRLLVAQSISEPIILLTTDAKLVRYGNTVRVL